MTITLCANCGHKVSTLAPACPACGGRPPIVASSTATGEIARYLTLFTLALLVFVCSPVTQLADSKYSVLLSESILTHRSADIKRYSIPGLDPSALPAEPDLIHNDPFFWQLVRNDDKLLYYYPHGSSFLSLPLVAVLRILGSSVVRSDGSYDEAREELEQLLLAGFLMAALACIFLRTAEILLPPSWGLAVAIGAAFGTQIWSTATRALWSHTWEIMLLGAVVLELLSAEEERRRLHMVWLATLVSWMFFVRPTGAIVVAGVTIYVFLYHRRDCLPYALTGLAWLLGFISYSLNTFGQILPAYYRNRSILTSRHFAVALAANLASPSRGLLVFVPVLLVVALIVIRYWRVLPHRRLAVLAGAVSGAHMLIVSADAKWWGGWSYGPRLSTDLVPWFVLLAILSLRSLRDDVVSANIADRRGMVQLRARDGLLAALACLLLALSIVMNARGALSQETATWNSTPNIDLYPERVWDWRAPQFLAGLIPQR